MDQCSENNPPPTHKALYRVPGAPRGEAFRGASTTLVPQGHCHGPHGLGSMARPCNPAPHALLFATAAAPGTFGLRPWHLMILLPKKLSSQSAPGLLPACLPQALLNCPLLRKAFPSLCLIDGAQEGPEESLPRRRRHLPALALSSGDGE